MELAAIALIAVGLYAGWNLGANDAANCIGTAVGSGIMSFRRAIILTSIFAVTGAVLQGHNVMKTLGAGILPAAPAGAPPLVLPALGGIVAMLAAGLLVTVATAMKIPVSTSQAIVGGVIGACLGHFSAANTSKIYTILQCWALCPVLTMILAHVTYRIAARLFRKIRNTILAGKVIGGLMTVSACYVAYSLGANNVGNAMGPASELGLLPVRVLALIGGLAICVGMITFGRGVADTIGKSITPLNPLGAFSAQLAAGFGIHVFSMIGIPVSTSHSIVGAVVGVGLVKGTRAVSKGKLVHIAAGWVVVPGAAGLLSYGIYRLAILVGLGTVGG